MIIQGFHAHIYYNQQTFEQARALCEQAAALFPLTVGRFHQQCVGPHPQWSCQLAFETCYFGEVVPWLTLHRNGLTVFIHALTGNDFKDHTDHAIWMGEMETLNLSIFK